MLDFSDIKVINEDTKVPLEEIAAFLDIPFEIEKGITYIRKNGIEISYNESSKKTSENGTPLDWLPIVKVNGKLFISVNYIALEMGYKVHDFPKQNTQRIYRDDYGHMSHADFEIYLNQILNKQTIPPPAKAVEKAKATIYLTFDDGPNKFTTINNTTLKKYNVQGTFFFVGNYMKKNEAIINSVVKDGHYIGTHSMTHDKEKVYKTSKSFINEMNEGIKLIKQMTGKDAKLVRTPYGSKPDLTAAMQTELIKNGYKLWDWDVDSKDWKYTDKETNQIVKNVKAGIEKSYKSGDRDIIVLLHDRSQTTKALPEIIEWLQKEGYALKTYEPDHHIVKNFLRDTSL
ncbi:polysaccharide deacetylase family protein [Psychrobacillus glaciei]|uniref:polysaccharide deacetylase family protein n=1 Tax=Psychrobacillus glaciei TaxID=2283160 RepID=UPI001CEFAA3A|nr:polysaccharide deacetylase family protein [Psychrobacillus glaciei]